MSKRVLIVDDNHEIVRATSLRLRAAGYDIAAAYDGQQGIESAVKERPDVIVLDVQMPVKDGLTALNELQGREETCCIPVVMLSASIVDQQSALKAGARYFLKKPHDGRQLIDALNTVTPH